MFSRFSLKNHWKLTSRYHWAGYSTRLLKLRSFPRTHWINGLHQQHNYV